MRRLLPLLLLCLASEASAITLPMAGQYLDLGAGGTLDTASPVRLAPSWRGAAGVWFGHYDKDYALGQYHSFGVSLDQAWLRGELATTLLAEYRNGIDIIVVGPYWFLAAGPELAHRAVGVTGLAGGGVEYRLTPYTGLSGRIGAGATWIDDVVRARVLVQLGVTWSRPFKRHDVAMPP